MFEVLVIVIPAIVGAIVALVTNRIRERLKSREIAGVEQDSEYRRRQEVLMLLVEERLKCYPELSTLLSEFIKRTNTLFPFNEAPVSIAEIRGFLAILNRIDSKISLLFSPESGERMRSLQGVLAKLALSDGTTQDMVKAVGNASRELEKRLRADLGIYGVQYIRGKVVPSDFPGEPGW